MSDTSSPSLAKAPRSYRATRQPVPAFARFEGTSAWKKDRRRAREYARFVAATRARADAAPAAG